jgi:hypothetical protein
MTIGTGTNPVARFGPNAGIGNLPSLWMSVSSPGGTNYALLSDGSGTYVNGAGGVYIRVANSPHATFLATGSILEPGPGGLSVGIGGQDFGGGVGGLGIFKSTTNPTSLPITKGNIYVYGDTTTGSLGIDAYGLEFPGFVANPYFGQVAPATGNGGPVFYNGQPGASGNNNGGNTIVTGGLPTGFGVGGTAAMGDGQGLSAFAASPSGVAVTTGGTMIFSTLAPQGTRNSQTMTCTRQPFTGRSTTNTGAYYANVNTATGTSGSIDVYLVQRAITAPVGGAIGDTETSLTRFAFKNTVASGLALVGTPVVLATVSDGSMASSVAVAAAASTFVDVGTLGIVTTTIDVQGYIDECVN